MNTLARHVLSILLLVALPLVTVITAHAQTPLDIRKKYDINIPRPLDAATALNRLAEQTDVYLLFPYKDAKARKANPVTGNYTLLEALRILLHGSGLKSGLSENGVLMISVGESPESDQSEQSEGKETMDTKKTILTAAIAYLLSGGSVQEVVAEEAAADATKRDRKKIE